jgi:hypothetical protein
MTNATGFLGRLPSAWAVPMPASESRQRCPTPVPVTAFEPEEITGPARPASS